MNLDSELIFKYFLLFTDLPDTELEKWKGLCEKAGAEIDRRRKRNADFSRNMERLCSAAAACAYCDYMMISSGGARFADAIRIGDISVQSTAVKSTLQDAAGIRDHFLMDIADLIEVPADYAFAVSECGL